MSQPKHSSHLALRSTFFAHRALLRDVELLHRSLQALSGYSSEQLLRLQKWYLQFRKLLERHHQAEDHVLFQELERRSGSPSEAIEDIEAEHQHLQFLLDEIQGLLHCAVAEGQRNINLLQQRGIALLELMRSHIASEERLVVNMMNARWSHDDQWQLESKLRRQDPFAYQVYYVPWVEDRLNSEERHHLYRLVPWYVCWAVRWWGRPQFRHRWRTLEELPKAA
ncbi:MAG: hemerythrin domain-containing protein [Chitinophagales bacterium]|nr:hemerythrin domain-containing protein [Chitinophagales bacterium]MDW8393908.1 hemerythrin domain-containing protein [Chitinophagales bacterium]